MTTYRTGNPIGSTDPRDLYDNAENLDTAVNDLSRDTWSDRLGRSRKTMSGMDREFNADQASRDNRFNTFITSSGYQFLGDYAAGIEITEYNQIVRDSDGEFWRLSGQVELPYTTTGAGLPEDDSLTPLGDAVLRQELDGSVQDGQGGAMVRGAVIYVNTIADLQALPTSGLVDGQVALLNGIAFRWDAVKGDWQAINAVSLSALGGVPGGGANAHEALEKAVYSGLPVIIDGDYYVSGPTITNVNPLIIMASGDGSITSDSPSPIFRLENSFSIKGVSFYTSNSILELGSDVDQVTIEDCEAECTTLHAGIAFLISSGQYSVGRIRASGNKVTKYRSAFFIAPATLGEAIFSENILGNLQARGIHVVSGDETNYESVIVRDNVIYDINDTNEGTRGIIVTAKKAIVSNNIISSVSGNKEDSEAIYARCTHIDINNNTCIDAGSRAAISVRGTAEVCKIVDNLIRYTPDMIGAFDRGISLPLQKHAVIAGNVLIAEIPIPDGITLTGAVEIAEVTTVSISENEIHGFNRPINVASQARFVSVKNNNSTGATDQFLKLRIPVDQAHSKFSRIVSGNTFKTDAALSSNYGVTLESSSLEDLKGEIVFSDNTFSVPGGEYVSIRLNLVSAANLIISNNHGLSNQLSVFSQGSSIDEYFLESSNYKVSSTSTSYVSIANNPSRKDGDVMHANIEGYCESDDGDVEAFSYKCAFKYSEASEEYVPIFEETQRHGNENTEFITTPSGLVRVRALQGATFWFNHVHYMQNNRE